MRTSHRGLMAARLHSCHMFLCLTFVLFFAGCGRSSHHAPQRTTVTILCASSALPAISKVAESYESSIPAADAAAAPRIIVASGPSNMLAQQILAGAPADLFLCANREWACRIEQEDRVAERVDLLFNRLVLVVPNGHDAGIQTLADLATARDEFERISIAVCGQYVPLGIYSEQCLKQLNLLEAVHEKNNVVRTGNARATLALVERGEVDAAIVYLSDAQASDAIEIREEISPAMHEEIVYPLLLLGSRESGTADGKAARAFFQYLSSPAALGTLADFGFRPAGF